METRASIKALIEREKAINELEEAMRNAREKYVENMAYEDTFRFEYKDITYTQIPHTKSYFEDNNFGIIKTNVYGGFVLDKPERQYVEIEYGPINEEYSYVDGYLVKKSEIKFIYSY